MPNHQVIKNITKNENREITNINFECDECGKIFSTFELCKECDHEKRIFNKRLTDNQRMIHELNQPINQEEITFKVN